VLGGGSEVVVCVCVLCLSVRPRASVQISKVSDIENGVSDVSEIWGVSRECEDLTSCRGTLGLLSPGEGWRGRGLLPCVCLCVCVSVCLCDFFENC